LYPFFIDKNYILKIKIGNQNVKERYLVPAGKPNHRQDKMFNFAGA